MGLRPSRDEAFAEIEIVPDDRILSWVNAGLFADDDTD